MIMNRMNNEQSVKAELIYLSLRAAKPSITEVFGSRSHHEKDTDKSCRTGPEPATSAFAIVYTLCAKGRDSIPPSNQTLKMWQSLARPG